MSLQTATFEIVVTFDDDKDTPSGIEHSVGRAADAIKENALDPDVIVSVYAEQ